MLCFKLLKFSQYKKELFNEILLTKSRLIELLN